MSQFGKFPTIQKAAIIIALDNGMINRFCSEKEFLENAAGAIFADGVPEEDVRQLETFLSGLSEEDLETICCGESIEMAALETDAPFSVVEPSEKVTRLLNDIFEA